MRTDLAAPPPPPVQGRSEASASPLGFEVSHCSKRLGGTPIAVWLLQDGSAWCVAASDGSVGEQVRVEDAYFAPLLEGEVFASVQRTQTLTIALPLLLRGRIVGVVEATFGTDPIERRQADALRGLAHLLAQRLEREAGGSTTPLRYYYDTLRSELERTRADDVPLTIVRVNISGYMDNAMLDSAAEQLRLSDTWFKVGHGEFAIVMPNTTEEQARAAVTRVVGRVVFGSSGALRASVGVAQANSEDAPEILDERAVGSIGRLT